MNTPETQSAGSLHPAGYAAAIARMREMADVKRATVACARGVSTDWQDEQYEEMRVLLTAAQRLEEDSVRHND